MYCSLTQFFIYVYERITTYFKELQALENLQENERSNENLRRELMKALAEKDSCEKHLEESKMTLETSLKNEQKARQERDELKGKTIIMESMYSRFY